MGLILAFDTATHLATVALLDRERVVGERTTRAVRVLSEADELLSAVGAGPSDIQRLVVGTGPGSFTGLRLGLAMARGLALARGTPAAGVSTLEALAAGAPGAVPLIDGGRREVFALVGGEPCSLLPGDLEAPPGTACIGDGAVRYRAELEALGLHVPPDDAREHVAHASLHARLALARDDFRDADLLEPIYVRAPDAKVPA